MVSRRKFKREPSERAKQLRQRNEEDPSHNVSDAAYFLNVDESTVLRLIRNGDIAATKLGKEYRIRESELLDFQRRTDEDAREEARQARARRRFQELYLARRTNPVTAAHWAHIICRTCGDSGLLQLRF